MKLEITFKNFERSDSIVKVVEQKTEHLEKFFHGDFSVHWSLWVEDNAQHAEIHLTRKGINLFAKAEDFDLYKALDHAIKKMKTQLEKNKEMTIDHNHKKNPLT